MARIVLFPTYHAGKMLVLGLTLCVTVINGIVPETSTAVDVNLNATTMDMNLSQDQTTPHGMFQEVKKQTEDAQYILEDTQYTLEDAVHQMDNESAKSSRYVHNVTSNYSESFSETLAGNQSIPTAETIDKVSGNTTEEIHISRTVAHFSGKENDIDHECITDQDCEKGMYCLYESHHSTCLVCKELNARHFACTADDGSWSKKSLCNDNVTCSKDEECCEGDLCVWGQCTKNITKGEVGTICQHQSDCNSNLCCAFQKALVFPVCSPRPIERERCVISANHLLELLSWDMEGEGPKEHCPCAEDLQCQHLGRGSFCLKGQSSSEENLTDTLYSDIDYIV